MIIEGDSLEELRKLETDSVDFICTDPPYGYCFMGKHWDKAVPSVELWMECLRVLKPGGFINVMSAPRSDVLSRMIVNIEDAGFRVDFTPIYWTYASGFPKAGNIGKLVDKRLGIEPTVIGDKPWTTSDKTGGQYANGGDDRKRIQPKYTKATSPEAKALDGSYAGFQPKPAVEVIIVAMKPLSQKTFVDQALDNGKGISWLDDGRIPTGENLNGGAYAENSVKDMSDRHTVSLGVTGKEFVQPQGRFPANLLVSDDVLNDGVERKTGNFTRKYTDQTNPGGWKEVNRSAWTSQGDSGSYSRYFDLDKWHERNNNETDYVPDKVANSGSDINNNSDKSNFRNRGAEVDQAIEDNRLKTLPFLIVPKASKSEKNKGLELLVDQQSMSQEVLEKGGTAAVGNHNPVCQTCKGSKIDRGNGVCICVEPNWKAVNNSTKNHHPTVKPLKLMSYLITLFSREGDIVLDPFVGSGTTCVAAKKLKREYIGIEREAEYVGIAEARLVEKQASLL